jgi:hypothetical protein
LAGGWSAANRAPWSRRKRTEAPRVQGFWGDGARGTRTPDLVGAIHALSQLSYSPAHIGRSGRCDPRSVVAERPTAGAVWFGSGMGLLDDAIREHLELKRRSGADPAAVERDELEALAPVYPDEDRPLGSEHSGLTHVPDTGVAHTDFVSGDAATEGHNDIDPRMANLGGVGQDTAEIDMRAVLEEDADVANAAHPVRPAGGGVSPAYNEELPEAGSFEWEQPGSSQSDLAPEGITGQERLSFE